MPLTPASPVLRRLGTALVCDTAAGALTIVASSQDRASPRWFRAVDTAGRTVTPWVSTPRIAARIAINRSSR